MQTFCLKGSIYNETDIKWTTFLRKTNQLQLFAQISIRQIRKLSRVGNRNILLNQLDQWFLTFQPTRTHWAFVKFSRTPCLKSNSNWYCTNTISLQRNKNTINLQ